MNSTAETVHVLKDAWKLMVERLPNGKVEQAEGVSTFLGHVPLPFFNLSMNDCPISDTGDLRRMLAIAMQRAASCEHPSMCALCEDWAPHDWESVAAEYGLVPALKMTGMAVEQIKPPRRPAPAIEFRRVTNESMARELAMLNAQGYGMPAELFDCIANMQIWHEDSYAFVGYSNGIPVTAAAALPVAGTVYIALVATPPEEQGKGYAEAVVRHTIAEGQKAMGFKRATLHATDMGQPVYNAIGFEPSARFVLLMQAPKEGTSGH